MLHNALVIASTSLPAGRDPRRRLGAHGFGADPAFHCLRLEGLAGAAAARLAALMLRAGGEASAGERRGAGRALLLAGGATAWRRFIGAAERVPALRAPGREAAEALQQVSARRPTLRLRRGTLVFDGTTVVMGVLNVTPDSFSDGGRFLEKRAAVEGALRMAEEGAGFIDVGAESTRPGALPVPLGEELRRVMPVLEAIVPALRRRGAARPRVSIDTMKSEVARRAAEAGVDLINDVSGMTHDPAMASVVAESGLPIVIQHMRGTPRTMQRAPRYRALLPEIAAFLRRQSALARRAGVAADRIVVDPGIGFGKRRRDNLAILRRLAVLRSLGRPILVGASRKSFIGGTLELPVSERLEGSLAAEALAIVGGADIIRAHDVRPAVRVARLCDVVLRSA